MKPDTLLDLHIYGGALLVAVGVASYQPPAGLAVFGLFLLGLGLAPPRRRPDR